MYSKVDLLGFQCDLSVDERFWPAQAQTHKPQQVVARDVITPLSPRASSGFSCRALLGRTVAP